MKIIAPPEVDVEFLAGADIKDALDEAYAHAKEHGQTVVFSFNSIPFRIDRNSMISEAVKEYRARLKPITGSEYWG